MSQLGPVVFAPVSDLKSISQAGLEGRGQLGVTNRSNAGVTISGGQILGDEWAEHVVKNRAGIILRARLVFGIFRTGDANSVQHPPQVRSVAPRV